MDSADSTSTEQNALWNGAAGQTWVEAQEALDQMFEPFEGLLVDAVYAARAIDAARAVEARGAPRVLDVGCGTGATTLAFARRGGQSGACTGVDISEPMIALARARAQRESAPPVFVVADAATHAFERASFDAIVSRFGVMFFDDPVKAFANLRRAARQGAVLRVVAWRSPEENPFMTAAERAVGSLLPSLPLRRPDEPGQFAFADRERVRRILEPSEWRAIDIEPIDVVCTFPEKHLGRYATRMGPVGRALREVDDATRERVETTVRAAFEPYVDGPDVRLVAACWMIAARA